MSRLKVEAVTKNGKVVNLTSRFHQSEKETIRDAQSLSFERFTYANKDELVVVSRREQILAIFRGGVRTDKGRV